MRACYSKAVMSTARKVAKKQTMMMMMMTTTHHLADAIQLCYLASEELPIRASILDRLTHVAPVFALGYEQYAGAVDRRAIEQGCQPRRVTGSDDRGIVERHGAQPGVVSTQGRGLRFAR